MTTTLWPEAADGCVPSPVVAVAEAAEAAAGLEGTDGIPSLPAGWPAAEPPLSPGDREGSPSTSSEEEEVKVGLTAEATEQEEAGVSRAYLGFARTPATNRNSILLRIIMHN